MNFMLTLEEVCECYTSGVSVTFGLCVYSLLYFFFFTFFCSENASSLREA